MGALHQAVIGGIGGAAPMTFANLFDTYAGSGGIFGTAGLVCYVERDVTSGTAGASTISVADALVGTIHDTVNDIWYDTASDGVRGTLRNPSGSIWALENTADGSYISRTPVMTAQNDNVIAAAMMFPTEAGSGGATLNRLLGVQGLSSAAAFDFHLITARASTASLRQISATARIANGATPATTTTNSDWAFDAPLWVLSEHLADAVSLETSDGLDRTVAHDYADGTYSANGVLFQSLGNCPDTLLYGFLFRQKALTTEERTFVEGAFAGAYA